MINFSLHFDHFLGVRSPDCKVGIVCVCLMPLVVQRQLLLVFSCMQHGIVGINELMRTSFNSEIVEERQKPVDLKLSKELG